MAQSSDNTTLEGRLATLEAGFRSLMAGNWTDLASVVDAAGNAVPLASLAFGQVAAIWAGTGVVSITNPASPGVDAKTAPSSVWVQPDPGLQLTVLVKGGRLRVDWAGLLALAGATGAGATIVMSYTLDYLGPAGAQGSVNQRVVDVDYYRGIQIRDNPAVANTGQQGSWYMHTGLTPGWYRVWAAWILGSGAASGQSQGSCDNPRIAATPF